MRHFCFTCGCIGHVAANYEREPEDHRFRFGAELRASPPHKVSDIVVQSGATRVARPLFQAGFGMGTVSGLSGMTKRGSDT
jgi:hypothetical protein